MMQLISNPIIQSVFLSVAIAQIIKSLIDWRTHGHFHWQSLLRGAGMPSSHTATVVALVFAVYLWEGIGTIFIVTLIFALIVVRDVIGDKVFATHQERILNKLIQQIMSEEKVEWTHLIGHTMTEVFAGFVIGMLVTGGVFYFSNLI